MPMLTLNYGEMEMAFDPAAREIEQDASILDGGNAVSSNIGDDTPKASLAVALDF